MAAPGSVHRGAIIEFGASGGSGQVRASFKVGLMRLIEL